MLQVVQLRDKFFCNSRALNGDLIAGATAERAQKMQSSCGGGIGGQAPLQSATEFNKHFGPMRKSQVAHCKRHKKTKALRKKKESTTKCS